MALRVAETQVRTCKFDPIGLVSLAQGGNISDGECSIFCRSIQKPYSLTQRPELGLNIKKEILGRANHLFPSATRRRVNVVGVVAG
jgi:hypothetical protein